MTEQNLEKTIANSELKIAIIGAGLSGLVLANKLKNYSQVTIFEKSRGVSGRMTTRYIEDYEFDHGTQHFTVKNSEFREFLTPFIEQNLLQKWPARFCEITLKNSQDSPIFEVQNSSIWGEKIDHFVGTPRMNSLCKKLSENLDIKLQTQVAEISKNGDLWEIFDDKKNSLGQFNLVISSTPSQQATALMPKFFSKISEIQNIKMLGCFALMIGFDNRQNINFDAAIIKNAKISWIAHNSSKPSRKEKFCLVVHSSNAWAEANMERDLSEVKSELISEAQKFLDFDLSQANICEIHRWRYANIKKRTGEKFFYDKKNGLATCGDWQIQGRIEAAFISANDLAKEVIKNLKSS